MRRNGGFTLIELMMAVAILGILAGVLIYSFGKPANKVKTGSEVSAMFAELHRAESQHAVENGTYVSTGSSESDVFPATPGRTPTTTSGAPDEWTTLKIQATSEKLYCGYVAVAGTSADSIPTFASGFGMTQPASNWYALYAKCDPDGDGVLSEYFASSVDQTLVRRGEGE